MSDGVTRALKMDDASTFAKRQLMADPVERERILQQLAELLPNDPGE